MALDTPGLGTAGSLWRLRHGFNHDGRRRLDHFHGSHDSANVDSHYDHHHDRTDVDDHHGRTWHHFVPREHGDDVRHPGW